MFDVFRYGVQVTGKETTFPRLVSWETMFSKRTHCRCPCLKALVSKHEERVHASCDFATNTLQRARHFEDHSVFRHRSVAMLCQDFFMVVKISKSTY